MSTGPDVPYSGESVALGGLLSARIFRIGFCVGRAEGGSIWSGDTGGAGGEAVVIHRR